MATPIGNENSGAYVQINVGGGTAIAEDVNNDGKLDKGALTGVNGHSTDGMVRLTEKVLQDFRAAGVGITTDGEGDETLDRVPPQFNDAVTRTGAMVAQIGSENDFADVQGQWADFIGQTNYRGQVDVNALVQAVLREAYLQNTEDLKFYAQKVSMLNDLKQDIRDRLQGMRSLMGEQAGRDDKLGLVKTGPYQNANGKVGKVMFDMTPKWNSKEGQFEATGEYSEGVLTTKGDLEAYITNLEELLNSVGDDAQLANVDLQNMLQKQQQTLQMMSNISKMLHDTAMAVIRKMGG